MSDSKAYLRAKSCIDQCVESWNKTNLSDIEKWGLEAQLIHGMIKMALYFLNFDDYNKLKEYIWTEYGFNVGGTRADGTN